MNDEQWKEVSGSPRHYVSNLGRVANELRGPGSWRIMKASKNNVGYLGLSIPVGGRRKFLFVHRLVAFAFLAPQPTPTHEVNHKDGEKTNNRASNLQWMTRRENQLHRFAVLGQHTGKGETAPNAKLTETQAREILSRRERGESGRAIAADYGISTPVVYSIALGITWKHLTAEKRRGAEVVIGNESVETPIL